MNDFKTVRAVREWADHNEWEFYGAGRYTVVAPSGVSYKIPNFPITTDDSTEALLDWANMYLTDEPPTPSSVKPGSEISVLARVFRHNTHIRVSTIGKRCPVDGKVRHTVFSCRSRRTAPYTVPELRDYLRKHHLLPASHGL